MKLLDILPNIESVIIAARLSLIVVAILVLCANVISYHICDTPWIEWLAMVCLAVNALYMMLLYIFTAIGSVGHYLMKSILLYVLLLLSVIPCVLMLLCGTDYMLYDILGEYIVYELDKIVLPLATIFFVSITYWIAIKHIYNMKRNYDKIKLLKQEIYNGK